MTAEITERCSCGASITVPAASYSVLSQWRAGHRHETKPADQPGAAAPAVDVKHAAALERRPSARIVGFSVEPDPGVRPWW